MKKYVSIIVTSIVSVVVTLGIISTVVWYFRFTVAGFFTSLQSSPYKISDTGSAPDAPAGTISGTSTVSESVAATVGATFTSSVTNSTSAAVNNTNTALPPQRGQKNEQKNNTQLTLQSTPAEVVSRTNASVVLVEVKDKDGARLSNGSGFFVSKDGIVITNRHVVDYPSDATVTVTTSDNQRYVVTVVGKDPVLDVALLQVVQGDDTVKKTFPVIPLGNSDKLALGQSVIVIGSVLGKFQNSVSVGVVSGLARTLEADGAVGMTEHLDRVIQTDAAINKGNSGGPLLNLKGEVIGIAVATAQEAQNVSFALPINTVRTAIDSVKKNGKIIRPYVGVYYMQITPELYKKYTIGARFGVVVKRVFTDSDIKKDLLKDVSQEILKDISKDMMRNISNSVQKKTDTDPILPQSPAALAGIQENDCIIAIDGQLLDGDANFASIIRQKKIGTTIQLTVVRNGQTQFVPLTLAVAPEKL